MTAGIPVPEGGGMSGHDSALHPPSLRGKTSAACVRAARWPGSARRRGWPGRGPPPRPGRSSRLGLSVPDRRHVRSTRTSHSQRPAAMPSGTPTTRPTTAITEDCQDTAPASWRRVKPSVFSSAKSRRRWGRSHEDHVQDRGTRPPPPAPARIVGMQLYQVDRIEGHRPAAGAAAGRWCCPDPVAAGGQCLRRVEHRGELTANALHRPQAGLLRPPRRAATGRGWRWGRSGGARTGR